MLIFILTDSTNSCVVTWWSNIFPWLHYNVHNGDDQPKEPVLYLEAKKIRSFKKWIVICP
jgi:hypothetical protein